MTWTRERVRTELLNVLKAYADEDAKVTETSRLVADLGIDSLGVMEILSDLEDKFELHFPDETLRDLETVADVAVKIEDKLQHQGRLEG